MLSDCGHILKFEAPGQFNRRIGDFFRQHS